jgi:hypothetical protein
MIILPPGMKPTKANWLLDWSKLPVRPYGWEPDPNTRNSRGSARAKDHRANEEGEK